jgi:nucleotide-binding universal stress UspA family protein
MASFRSILCPVDFSEHSVQALRLALGLANLGRARLTALAVAEPLLVEAAAARYGERYVELELRKELEALITTTVAQASWAVAPELMVTTGAPPDEILACAAAQKSDLIVMGTHGLGGYRKTFFGSVTGRVLRRARVPVLATPLLTREVVDLSSEAARFHIPTVLVPMDFGDGSTAQLLMAASVATDVGASLLLLHVLAEPGVPRGWSGSLGVRNEQRVEETRHRLSELGTTHAGGVPWEVVTATGSTADEIARVATERHTGMIVMGLTGQDATAHRPGSVAYRVLTLAPVPVLAAFFSASSSAPNARRKR